MSVDLKQIRCVVFDLDGTVYFGKELALKANEVILECRKRFEYIFFATNNSAMSRWDLHQRLQNFGIACEIDELINSSYLIAQFLLQQKLDEVYCFGTDKLKEELQMHGIDADSKSPSAIVIGYDKDFNLDKLEKAINRYKSSCQIIVANKERTYPRDNGILAPGAGAIVSAFECCVNRQADVILGKPNTLMLEFIVKKLKLDNSNLLVIGDSVENDINMSKKFGCQSILVSANKPSGYFGFHIKELKDLLGVIQ